MKNIDTLSKHLNNSVHDLAEKTDLCVQCGLCLPYCPTYGKTENENESPRGRLALIQAWANKKLPASERLQSHIDNCLLCHSCEKVCPALVPYGEIIDDFRNAIQTTKKSTLDFYLVLNLAHHKKLLPGAQTLLKGYQSAGVKKTVQFLKLPQLFKLDKIDRLISNKQDSSHYLMDKYYYPAVTKAKGEVGLFRGCIGSLIDQETVYSVIKLLNIAGFNVHCPENQTCCGALDLHSGDKKTASHLEQINQQAFTNKEWMAIISTASGCGSQLQTYEDKEIANKTIDISQFLIDQELTFTSLEPLDSTVLVHTPCSLKNCMQQEQGALKLVEQIPRIKIKSISQNIHCCGSAGSYMLQHPKMAESLVDDLINAVTADKETPEYLVTSNIGCALHISARCRERHIELEVIHPVTLLARQLS